MLLMAGSAACLTAGELYGSITEAGKPTGAGAKVEITASGKVYAAETDKFGGYRIFVKEKGKCVLTIAVKDQSASADLYSYDKATRYDWMLESRNGKLSIRRK
jgi:hypothetical protein